MEKGEAGRGQKSSSFIPADGTELLREALRLPNCVHITQGNQRAERWKNSHPVCTSAHATHLRCPSLSAILGVIISFHGPGAPHHVDNRWGSRRACPVVLFLSTPVSLIIAKILNPSVSAPWRYTTELLRNTNYKEEDLSAAAGFSRELPSV